MPRARGKKSEAELALQLGALQDGRARREFLATHNALVRSQVVQRLAPLVVEKIRVDAKQALLLAEGILLIARKGRRKEDLALAMRAKGNALFACDDNLGAAEYHEQAFRIYESLKIWKEAARTLSNSIQPLILLGEYDRAFAAAERAREIFTQLGEQRRLASLENNVGNIFHRQDRFEEALERYERACKALSAFEDWEHVAVALHNMAMCLINLNEFARSMECYEKARDLCARFNLPRLRDQADYNIAYLYYFRGDYSRAIDMLLATRRSCEKSGDVYRLALCYLDLSDIYLELNLSEEAREMARQGFGRFEKLAMRYEAAKTLANEAIAYGQQGKTVQALERFGKAREMFATEKNLVWPWLLDLYQAVLLFHEGRFFEARRLCVDAAEFFEGSTLPAKALLCRLLLARIALQIDDIAAAEREAQFAAAKLSNSQAPVLIYQTHLLIGEIAHKCGDRAAAYAAFQEARKALEVLRNRLQSEELKISFVKNRLQVYEAIVGLHLETGGTEASKEEAFSCIEEAKSRSMMEMIFQSGHSLPAGEAGQSEYVRKIRDLREELNWYYHRIELEQLRPEEKSPERIARLQQKAQSHENELLRALRELPAQERENTMLEAAAEFSVAKVRESLPADSVLIEYYSTGERLLACLVSREAIEIIPVSIVSRVHNLLHLLRFQFAKFRMGSDYTERFAQTLLRATVSHLGALYDELIKPLAKYLTAKHLIIVPHGPLHFLPFHALRDGETYLCDRFTISYAPSATVFALCQRKPDSNHAATLLFGVPDERAPLILNEVQSVASLVDRPKIFVGNQATTQALREKGSTCGLLHIATHGIYRQDNPMFSAIKMGDGYLNLYDLYQMRLSANLVTLSGCATGMNVVAEGDELLGLQRGLFCAGAKSLVLSLWDVHDRATSELMQEFYGNYLSTQDAAWSLRQAMLCLREKNPHPYFWAPFVLIGKITDKQALSREPREA